MVRFMEETTSDWLRRFTGSGVPVGPINSIQEVFADPQVKLSKHTHTNTQQIHTPTTCLFLALFKKKIQGH